MAVLTNCGPKHPADWFRIAFEVLLENVHKIVFLTPSFPMGKISISLSWFWIERSFRFIWPNCIKFIHETWVGNKLSLGLLLQTTVWDLKVGIVVWGVGPPQGAFLTGPIVEAFKSCQIYLILVENRSQSAEVEEQRTSSLLHECNYCSIVNDKKGSKASSSLKSNLFH